MSVALDILRSYRRPREVLRRRLGGAAHEGRAFAVLIAGCLLVFIGQWPRIAREAYEDPSIPLDARMGGALFAWLFLAPLIFYAVAGLSHFVARLFGGRGTGYGARLALFWALLAAAPLWLLYGLFAGFVGDGPLAAAAGLAALGAFAALWLAGLWEVEHEAAS